MMKGIKFIFLFVILSLTISCNRQSNYLKVIPNDASCVIRIDVSNIFDRMQISGESISSQLVSKFNVDVNSLESLSILFESPEETGLNLLSPIYLFNTHAGQTCLVADIVDVDVFNEFVRTMQKDGFSTSVKKQNNVFLTEFFEKVNVVFDDSSLLLCLSSAEFNPISKQTSVVYLFQLEDTEMFVNTNKYSVLDGKSEYLSVYYSHYLPQGKAEMISSLSFVDNRIGLSTRIFDADKEVLEFLDEIESHTFALEGRFADISRSLPLVWGGIGVDGRWLLQLFKSNQNVKSMLYAIERGVDIEKIINSVHGELSFAFSEMPNLTYGENSEIVVAAELSNDDFLDDVNYWLDSMGDYGISMNKISHNQYLLMMGDASFNWGVTDNSELFVSTNNTFRLVDIHSKTSVLESLVSEMRSNKLFMYLNVEKFLDSAEAGTLADILCAMLNIGSPKHLLVKSASSRDFTIELVFQCK